RGATAASASRTRLATFASSPGDLHEWIHAALLLEDLQLGAGRRASADLEQLRVRAVDQVPFEVVLHEPAAGVVRGHVADERAAAVGQLRLERARQLHGGGRPQI